jgi:acetyl esterase
MSLHPVCAALFRELDRRPLISSGGEGSLPEVRRRAAEYVTALAGPPVAMASVRDEAVPGPGGPVPVRIYRPTEEAVAGVFVWLHGGGFSWGSVAVSDVLARALARVSGCLVVSVDYRLAPEHPFPAGLEDCAAVARWALARREELAGTDAGVAIGGESAGGNLAAATVLRLAAEGGAQVDFQALVYPRVSWVPGRPLGEGEGAEAMARQLESHDWIADLYLDGHAPDDPFAAPLLAPSLAGLPPALVVTAEYDTLRVEAERYAIRLIEAGVPVAVRRHPGMLHGFLDFNGLAGLAEVVEDGIAEIGDAVRRGMRPRRRATGRPDSRSLEIHR